MCYLLLEDLSTFQIKLNKAQSSRVRIGYEGLQVAIPYYKNRNCDETKRTSSFT